MKLAIGFLLYIAAWAAMDYAGVTFWNGLLIFLMVAVGSKLEKEWCDARKKH
jgi:hypothetical protein